MTGRAKESDPLEESVRKTRTRREQAARKGERPVAKNLAMIGAIGWLIVAPTLLGIFAGRWLDQSQEQSVFWTLSLMFIGLVAGCVLAWKRMNRE